MLPTHTDVAIIGGGYTGLACALELAKRKLHAVVVDADRIGYNASSRNGGLVVGGLKLALAGLERTIGVERTAAIVAEGIGTLAFLEDLIAREGIACHYQRQGRLVCAYTRSDFEKLAASAPLIERLTGAPAYALPQERQHEEIGSQHYCGGLVIEAAAGLHPALYVRGLAEAARRAGAQLIDQTPVTGLERIADYWSVITTGGVIKCREVMLATNGYTGPLLPWFHRRIVPVTSFMIATEPLSPEVVRRLIPNAKVLADTRRLLNYFRLSPDGTRLLWGGRVGSGHLDPRVSATRLHRAMRTVFPDLAGARVTHSWSGNVAFTFDFLPHIGSEGGVHYALGCQGSGVAMQTWLGTQAALKIAGVASRPSAFDGLKFPTVPMYTGRPWFLPGVLAWYRLRDSIDRMAG